MNPPVHGAVVPWGWLQYVALGMALAMAPGSAGAQSQVFEPERPLPHSSLTLVIRGLKLWRTGDQVPTVDLDFSGLAFGARWNFLFWRENGQLSMTHGAQSEGDKTVWDVELSAWHRTALGGPGRCEAFLLFPIVLEYRRLRVLDTSLEHESVGLLRAAMGVGLAFDSRLHKQVVLRTRATPLVVAPMSRTQQERFWPRVDGALDGDFVLELERVLGKRRGLSLGVHLRLERVSVVSDKFFPDSPDSWVSFEARETSWRLGVHW